jgi:hypothetical protein
MELFFCAWFAFSPDAVDLFLFCGGPMLDSSSAVPLFSVPSLTSYVRRRISKVLISA